MTELKDPKADDRRYFFVHVMKVAGFSLLRMIRTTVYDRRYVYPNADDTDAISAYIDFDYIKQIPEDRKRGFKVFAGHLPLAAREHLGDDVRAFAFFRDPVQRAISHLKHATQRVDPFKGLGLMEAFERPDVFQMFVDNHQLRYFTLRSLDGAKTVLDPQPLAAGDIERAVQQVRTLDFIGLTEDFDDSIRRLWKRYEWPLQEVLRVNQTKDCEIPDGLEERLEAVLQPEIEFYRAVRQLYYERKESV